MRRGVTLAETVIALFILVSSFTVVAALFHSSLRQQARTEQRALAVQLAKKRLAELRAWARTNQGGNQFNFDLANSEWEGAVDAGDPDYPGLQVRVAVRDQVLYSPCSAFEVPYRAFHTDRHMDHSAKSVKVVVRDPNDTGSQVSLVSLVCDPTREFGGVTLLYEPPTGKMVQAGNIWSPAAGSTLPLSVTAQAPDGSALNDLFFDWYCVPLGGNGTVLPARDGRTCTFVNGVRTGWPPGLGGALGTTSTGGQVVVAVYGTYRGIGQAPLDYDAAVGSPYIKVTMPPIELQ